MADMKNEISQAKPSALPDSWIERLFDKLSAMYGNRFTDMWRGIDPEMVKREWAESLVSYPPAVLKYALDQCKDTSNSPPSLPQFIGFCRTGMARNQPAFALPAPTMDRETARARLRQVAEKAGIRLRSQE